MAGQRRGASASSRAPEGGQAGAVAGQRCAAAAAAGLPQALCQAARLRLPAPRTHPGLVVGWVVVHPLQKLSSILSRLAAAFRVAAGTRASAHMRTAVGCSLTPGSCAACCQLHARWRVRGGVQQGGRAAAVPRSAGPRSRQAKDCAEGHRNHRLIWLKVFSGKHAARARGTGTAHCHTLLRGRAAAGHGEVRDAGGSGGGGTGGGGAHRQCPSLRDPFHQAPCRAIFIGNWLSCSPSRRQQQAEGTKLAPPHAGSGRPCRRPQTCPMMSVHRRQAPWRRALLASSQQTQQQAVLRCGAPPARNQRDQL